MSREDTKLDFGAFSGQPSEFLTREGAGFKTNVLAAVRAKPWQKRFVLQAGQTLFDAIQPIVELEAGGEESEHVCQGKTAAFEDYEDIFTDEFLEDRLTEAGIFGDQDTSRIRILRGVLGDKHWDDAAKLNKTQAALEQQQDTILLDDMQDFVIAFIKGIRVSFKSAAPSKYQTEWTRYLQQQEFSRIVMGHDATIDWIKKPWLNPATKLWVRMLAYYDKTAEAASTNFIDELVDSLASIKAPDADSRKSVFAAMSTFEDVWRTAAKSFDDKDAMVDWVVTVYRMKLFETAASDPKAENSLAWEKAVETMTSRSKRGVKPKLEDTDAAIAVAEKYLKKPGQESAGANAMSINPDDELQALRAQVELLQKQVASGEGQPQKQRQKQQQQQDKADQAVPCAFCKKHGHEPAVHNMKFGCRREQEHNLAEMEKLRDKRQKNTAKKLKKSANRIAALDDNKDGNRYSNSSACLVPWSQLSTHEIEIVSGGAILGLKGIQESALVDSGSQAHLVHGLNRVLRKYDRQNKLVGVQGPSSLAQCAQLGLPVCIKGDWFLLKLSSGGLYASQAKENIVSLALLMKAGFVPDLKVGTDADPHDGGTLTSPCGRVIKLHFEHNLWRLPLWTVPKNSVTPKSRQQSAVPTHNAYSALQELDKDVVPPSILKSASKSAKSADAAPKDVHWNLADDVVAGEHTEQSVNVFSFLPADLTKQQKVQMIHEAWGHPGNSKLLQIYKKHGPKNFPIDFSRALPKFSCQVCAVCKGSRSYRHTAKFKNRNRSPSNGDPDSGESDTSSASDSENIDSGECHSCQCFNLHSEFEHDTVFEHNPSVTKPLTSDNNPNLDLPDFADQTFVEPLHKDRELSIDFAHAIAVGFNGEKYYLIMVLGRQLFVWCSATKRRQSPEELIQEFVDATGVQLAAIRFDDAAEFGRSSSFKAWAKKHGATLRPVAAYSHTLNARAEGAIRITKEHVRCMLKTSNLPRKFWPYALLQFMRVWNHWPNAEGNTGWENLPNTKFCYDLRRDIIPFGSLCTGHLPREHPLVQQDTTHEDRALEGAFLMWDLFTPTIWIYSFRLKKVVRLDPKHFSPHLYPLRDPTCLANRHHLTADDIRFLHDHDDSTGTSDKSTISTRSRQVASSDKGEKSPSLEPAQLLSKDAPKQELPAKEDREKVAGLGRGRRIRATAGAQVPLDEPIQDLNDAQLARSLAHNKFVFKLPSDYWNNPYLGKTTECTVIAKKAQKIKRGQYLWCDILEPKEAYQEGREIQIRVSDDRVGPDSHLNLRNALDATFDHPKTLADIGLTPDTVEAALGAMINLYSDKGYRRDQKTSARDPKGRFINNMVQAMTLGFALSGGTWNSYPPSDIIPELFPFADDDMNQAWVSMLKEDEDQAAAADDDMLEPDPPNRKSAMSHPRFAPFWLGGEREEMSGLWARNCFRKVSRKDLLPNDRVFSSRFHYHIKRDAITGRITRFKVRLVIQGHKMKASTEDKVGDYECSFAPVPHATVGRMIMAIAVAEDEECDAVDLTQAFIQADRLDEGVNGRWFMTPPPGSEEDDPDVVYEVLRPLYGIPSSARALNVTLDTWLKSEGFKTVGFEDSVWVRPAGGKYSARITMSSHIDDNLISCKSRKVLNQFKKEFLTRFDGTDEGPVTQYLGCEFIRDRTRRTGELRQSAYAQKVLKKFEMWNCNPVKTPLEAGYRLTKEDCPQVVDADLQRKFRTLTGSIGFLVTMTRPDLAFAYNELSKFVQYPGEKHWECGMRVLQYLRGTYDRGIKWCDPGQAKRHTLQAYVDSDFAACKDTRRSQTGYLVTMNGGPISWRAKRQSAVTLSSAEAEFVAASQCGVEIIYTRALMKGFGYEQKRPTVLWEDNESCRLMALNPVNRERSRHIDTRQHFLRELVKEKVLKVVKVKGTENPSDALTKSVPSPTLEKHREYLMGTRVPFQVFYGKVASAA